MGNFFGHLKTISKHKYLVTKYCIKIGLVKQGLLHDLSKFTPTEFFQGVKYFQGDRSPIGAEKRDLGYSKAWLHHKGRNKHHFEYWYDNTFDGGYEPLEMPFNYLCEMAIDRICACKTYQKDKYTDGSAYIYHMETLSHSPMHPKTAQGLTKLLEYMKDFGEEKGLAMIKNDLRQWRNAL